MLKVAWYVIGIVFLVVSFYQYPVVLVAVIGALLISVVLAGPNAR